MPAAIPIIAAAVTAAGSAYAAKKQGDSAEDAAGKQASGVQSGIDLQREFTDRAMNQLGTNFQNARTSLLSGQEQFGRIFDESGNVISGGYDRARGDVTAGAAGAEQALMQGADRSSQNLISGAGAADRDLISGYDRARGDITAGANSAEQMFTPNYQRGESASQLQAAFSGLMGDDAQRQAYEGFNESPGTDWLRKKQEEARLRTFSRLGGGLGNQASVMSALAEDEFGRAQTDFGNYYGRLNEISGRGDNAASNIAGIRSNLGYGLGDNSSRLAESRAGIKTGLGSALAGINTNAFSNIASNRSSLGSNLGNLSTGEGGALGQLIGTRAGAAQSTMQNLADLFRSEGSTAANIYTGAGTEQAQLAQNLGAARAGSDVYAAQTTPAWMQGLQAGAGAYTAAGGNFGSLFQGGGGNTQSGYTGQAYQNWLGR